jgi:hypothetical protein
VKDFDDVSVYCKVVAPNDGTYVTVIAGNSADDAGDCNADIVDDCITVDPGDCDIVMIEGPLRCDTAVADDCQPGVAEGCKTAVSEDCIIVHLEEGNSGVKDHSILTDDNTLGSDGIMFSDEEQSTSGST